MTAQQVAEQFGFPSARTLRSLRAQGLPAVKIGTWLFDPADVESFIQARKITQCPDRTAVPTFSSSGSANASTSNGMRAAANDSAARARLIAQGLKRSSPPSSSNAVEQPSPEGHVIRHTFQ
jgi:hypothetical protein